MNAGSLHCIAYKVESKLLAYNFTPPPTKNSALAILLT